MVVNKISGVSRISPRWGHQLSRRVRQHTILPNFSQNCMKLKEFGPWCVLAPPLDPPPKMMAIPIYFSFSMQFLARFCQIIGWAPPLALASPSGKSWICHWLLIAQNTLPALILIKNRHKTQILNNFKMSDIPGVTD